MVRSFAVLALVWLASGCGGALAAASAAGHTKRLAPGPTVSARIGAEDSWPFHVDHVALTLDGAPWGAPTEALAVGDHTVIAYLDASLPCDAFGARSGHVHLRSVRTFAVVPGDDAIVDVTLVDRGFLVPVEDRLALAVTPRGAHGTRGVIEARDTPECASRRDPRAHAACVLAPTLAVARGVGDAAATDCLERALTQMEAPHSAAELRAIEHEALACTEWAPLPDADQVASDCSYE